MDKSLPANPPPGHTSRGAPCWVYPFGIEAAQTSTDDPALLGNKGASLARMSRARLPVPPGFTITTECCRAYFELGQHWPPGLEEQVRAAMKQLEQATGRCFGRGTRPLLVSVRSGAAISMPGMMDTILNCGLHPGLADEVGDSPAFWRVYVQFIVAFARTVDHLPPDAFAHLDAGGRRPDRALAEQYLECYAERSGRPLPADPWQLLAESISGVFRSWNNPRAVAYRRRHAIRGLLGTAVNVQAMFPSEVSGILFTCDPNEPDSGQMVVEASYGLGEAVVSGEVTPDRFLLRRSDLGVVRAVAGCKSHSVAALSDELLGRTARGSEKPRTTGALEGDESRGTAPLEGNESRSTPALEGDESGGAAALGGDAQPSEEIAADDAECLCLSPAQLAELGRLGLRVEEHFGQPMDIEWGLAGRRFALLQCRPIRGLDVARELPRAREAEIARLKSLAGGKRRVWVAHNLGETLPAPTPLTWDIIRRFMSGSGGFGLMYQDLGYRPSPRVCREGFLELVAGRIYADPQRLAELFWGRGPIGYPLEQLAKDPSLLDQTPRYFDPEQADSRFFLRLPLVVWTLLRAARRSRLARRTVEEHFVRHVVPEFLRYVELKRKQDLTGLAPAELCQELKQRAAHVLDQFGKESLKPGLFGGLAFGELQALLCQILGPEEGVRMACVLTSGLEGDRTVEQNELLYRVARGEAPLERFLEEYGHRAAGEMELATPRWREEPEGLEASLQNLRRAAVSPAELHRQHARQRRQLEARLPELLARSGASALRDRVEAALHEAQRLLPWRESAKHYLMMGYELLRLVVLELARRWELGGDVFFLHLEELSQFDCRRGELQAAIAQRRLRWQAFQRLDVPPVVDYRELDRLGSPPERAIAAELSGEPVAAGIASGPARVVFDPQDQRHLGTQYVLVCPSTDPGWTALLVNARGLVVERGGVLSHGAIVARDFGIPAVVCPQATRLIPDGARIQVDGNRGVVRVLDGQASPPTN